MHILENESQVYFWSRLCISEDMQYGQIRSTPFYAALNAGIASEALLFTTVLLLMQKL